MNKLSISLCAALCAASLNAAEYGSGTVTAGTLNVRSSRSVASDVVCKLKRGDQVQVTRKIDDWFEIAAPGDMAVYAASNLIQNGKTLKELNMRAGPGLNYSSVGVIPPGVPVKVISVAGAWTKIAALPDVKCFVSSKFIKLNSAPSTAGRNPAADKPTAKNIGKSPAADKPETSAATSAAAALALEELRKNFAPGEGVPFAGNGIVNQLRSAVPALKYCLAETRNGKYQVICYLASSSPDAIAKLDGAPVKVTGRTHTIPGWKLPVVVVESIDKVAASATKK